MLLNEVTYAVLELMRNGGISDDEKMDFRLIEQFVHSKRAEYIQGLIDTGKFVPEIFYQYIATEDITEYPDTTYSGKIYKLDNVPTIITTRHGTSISEIVPDSETDTGLRISSLPFKVVNPHAFKYSGNGRFNTNYIFATYRENQLFIKSTHEDFNDITRFSIKAIFENPTLVADFDSDTDTYPITMNCFEYIKNTIITVDSKIFFATKSDNINNASGNVNN